jgi:hypothetical protein
VERAVRGAGGGRQGETKDGGARVEPVHACTRRGARTRIDSIEGRTPSRHGWTR